MFNKISKYLLFVTLNDNGHVNIDMYNKRLPPPPCIGATQPKRYKITTNYLNSHVLLHVSVVILCHLVSVLHLFVAVRLFVVILHFFVSVFVSFFFFLGSFASIVMLYLFVVIYCFFIVIIHQYSQNP